MKTLCRIYFLLLQISIINAQHSIVNSSNDIRSFGMGGCGVGIYNPINYINNTSHLGLISTSVIYADIRSYYFVEDLHQAKLQAILKSSINDAFGIEIQRDGSKEFNEIIIGTAYSRKILNKSSLGIGLQYYQQNAPESGVQRTFFPKIGLQLNIIPRLIIATQLNNPIPFFSKSLLKIPSQFKFGINYKIYTELNFYSEINMTNGEDTHMRFGIEYQPIETIAIRTGFVTNGNFSCGLSFKIKQLLELIVGYELHPVLKSSAGAGFAYRFKKEKV